MHRELPPVEDVVEWFRRNKFAGKRFASGMISFTHKGRLTVPALACNEMFELIARGNLEYEGDDIKSTTYSEYVSLNKLHDCPPEIWRDFDNPEINPDSYGAKCRRALEAAGFMVDDN